MIATLSRPPRILPLPLRPTTRTSTAAPAPAPAPADEEITIKQASRILGVPINTAYRLFHAGYIQGRTPSPRHIVVSKRSVERHKEATRDPEFWDTHPKPW